MRSISQLEGGWCAFSLDPIDIFRYELIFSLRIVQTVTHADYHVINSTVFHHLSPLSRFVLVLISVTTIVVQFVIMFQFHIGRFPTQLLQFGQWLAVIHLLCFRYIFLLLVGKSKLEMRILEISNPILIHTLIS